MPCGELKGTPAPCTAPHRLEAISAEVLIVSVWPTPAVCAGALQEIERTMTERMHTTECMDALRRTQDGSTGRVNEGTPVATLECRWHEEDGGGVRAHT